MVPLEIKGCFYAALASRRSRFARPVGLACVLRPSSRLKARSRIASPHPNSFPRFVYACLRSARWLLLPEKPLTLPIDAPCRLIHAPLEGLDQYMVALLNAHASKAVTPIAVGIHQITRVPRQSVRSQSSLLGLPAPCVIFRYLRSAPIFLGLLKLTPRGMLAQPANRQILGLKTGTLWDIWCCI
jgi:hypothetical protein